jgi:beta-phosphoglucomutase
MAEPAVAVLWDLDGTLADTEQGHFAAWQALCRQFGRELGWEQFKPTFGLGNSDILRMLIGPDLDDEEVERLSERKEALFRAETGGAITGMPGALALVHHLQALGVPQAIASSAPPENITFVLRALDLEGVFAAAVSRWQVARGKPFPDIFLRAAADLGAQPGRCVVLEDAPAGIQAGAALAGRALGGIRRGDLEARGGPGVRPACGIDLSARRGLDLAVVADDLRLETLIHVAGVEEAVAWLAAHAPLATVGIDAPQGYMILPVPEATLPERYGRHFPGNVRSDR